MSDECYDVYKPGAPASEQPIAQFVITSGTYPDPAGVIASGIPGRIWQFQQWTGYLLRVGGKFVLYDYGGQLFGVLDGYAPGGTFSLTSTTLGQPLICKPPSARPPVARPEAPTTNPVPETPAQNAPDPTIGDVAKSPASALAGNTYDVFTDGTQDGGQPIARWMVDSSPTTITLSGGSQAKVYSCVMKFSASSGLFLAFKDNRVLAIGMNGEQVGELTSFGSGGSSFSFQNNSAQKFFCRIRKPDARPDASTSMPARPTAEMNKWILEAFGVNPADYELRPA